MPRTCDPDLMKHLGKRLQGYRKARGWTQDLLAKRLGVQAVTLSRYETGQRTPPLPTLIRISRELDVSVDVLVGEKPDPNGQTYPPEVEEAVWILGGLETPERQRALRVLRVLEAEPRPAVAS